MSDAATKVRLNELAVENFRQYLRIPSVQPNVNYDGCVTFLRQQSADLNLQFKIVELVKSKPIVILTWQGIQPNLPSIMLNSHMDVVPVYPEFWKHEPFGAEMDENGNIYARGAQDMKSVGIQYLEAIRRLILNKEKFKRTIHIVFVPDEEIGGVDGMKKFVKTKEFKDLNIGFALDEGYTSSDSTAFVFNTERCIWQIEITCPGPEGHASLLMENTAGEKVRRLLDRIMDYRKTQLDKLNSDKNLLIGDVTTVNLTILEGGVGTNVIPAELKTTFDFRLSIDVDIRQFENQIKQWMNEAGQDLQLKWIQKCDPVPPTKVDESNKFWTAMKQKLNEMNLKFKLATFPAATDGRYCREIGIPVIGFSPIINTPPLLHAHNEFLNKNVFLDGIGIYEKIIPAIANVPSE